MGVNLCLYTKAHREHPDWDWTRYSGDREFAALTGGLPSAGTEDDLVRPTDFAKWRAAVADARLPNPGRHEKLLDLLEADEGYWLFVSC